MLSDAIRSPAAIDSYQKTSPHDFQNHEGKFFGAGDEARTRYLHLGKVALYRMSYTREGHELL